MKPERSGRIKAAPGVYMLLLDLAHAAEISFGRTRREWFDAGIYCYVGSAMGPGGLTARLGRYAAGPVRKHWHIDYFLDHARLIGAIVKADSRRLECKWADWVKRRATLSIDGFGASDCRCSTHLFRIGTRNDAERFIRGAGGDLRANYVGTGSVKWDAQVRRP